MRFPTRVSLVVLITCLAVLAVAEDSWAGLAGGSRLIFYYTQRSIVNPSAAPGTANTIIGITNQSLDDPVNVRVQIFNGQTCASFGPLTFNLSPRRTLRLNVNEQVSAASFPEGWVDVWAVDGVGQPIRWDQLMGKGTILDFAGAIVAATYGAAALFSDAPDRSDTSTQGTLIADHTNANTWGVLRGSVEFWGFGGSFGINDRLIVIPVSEVPGTVPVVPFEPILTFFKTDETETQSDTVSVNCMLASSLANLHPGFAAIYPATESLADGGNLDITHDLGGTKGFVGALFEFAANIPGLSVSPIAPFIGNWPE